ncbi:hypothetical protein GN244_ATG14588 [Phytophthora infestans]|uniref:Uncharacterized protein n=1 Tax=Phytophthora infestans TaxID=4787 RepID=A0A833SW72_PHYIN|nr:hypothetical protein GN244_ATG14588 [Phytophthora infestans]
MAFLEDEDDMRAFEATLNFFFVDSTCAVWTAASSELLMFLSGNEFQLGSQAAPPLPAARLGGRGVSVV